MTENSDTPKTEAEKDDASDDAGRLVLFAILGLWTAVGGFVYAALFWGLFPPAMNLPQKIFISLLCGPIGWLDAIYNLLGLLGEPK